MDAKFRFLSSMLIFGTIGLLVRNISLPSGMLVFLRGVIGITFLLLVCRITKSRFSFRAFSAGALLILLSGVILGCNWIFLFEAYRHTTIAVATITYYMAPTFLVLASSPVLKEKITRQKLFCVLAALFGMVLVSGLLSGPSLQMQELWGVLFGLLAAVSYASLTLLNKFIRGVSSMERTIAQIAIASLAVFPYSLLAESFTGISFAHMEILLIVVLGVVHTGIGFWLYFSSIPELKAQTMAIISYTDPVTAILLSALILDEKMTAMQIAGAVLILGATYISGKNLHPQT